MHPSGPPVFRLTYRQITAGQLRVSFEISPTGKPEDFKTYLDGTVNRRPVARP